jgi:hypothetical protein
MSSHHMTASPYDFADEIAGWGAGLGIITFVLFPLAVPFLALIAILVAPLALIGVLAAVIVALPAWLVRWVLGGRARRRTAADSLRAAGAPFSASGVIDAKPPRAAGRRQRTSDARPWTAQHGRA